jgi:hypothetical protein
MAALSQEIARLTLGYAGGVMQPIAPDKAGVVNSRLVAAYPLPALALFLTLLFAYSSITLALLIWCASVSSPVFEVGTSGEKLRTVSLTQLVQMRLTNPLSFVASTFDLPTSPSHLVKEGVDSEGTPLSLQTDTEKLFDESSGTARLHVGLIAPSNQRKNAPRFEIRQGPLTRVQSQSDGE